MCGLDSAQGKCICVCLTPKRTRDPNRHRCLCASCPFLRSQSPRYSNRVSCELLICIFMCYLVLWASESSAEITLESRLHVRREPIWRVFLAWWRGIGWCLTRTRRFRSRTLWGRSVTFLITRGFVEISEDAIQSLVARSSRNGVPVLQNSLIYVLTCGL